MTDEIGIVCLELDGPRDEVKAAIKWLEKQGVNVEPVEIGVIAGLKICRETKTARKTLRAVLL